MDKQSQILIDQSQLRMLADDYAKGADRRDKELWIKVLSEDCTMEGPGFHHENREQCLTSIDQLAAMFVTTRHNVLNQTVSISGDNAAGETYCIADHLMERDGKREILSWHIRYQDEWRRMGDGWQYTKRKLILDWEETRLVNQGNIMEK